MNYCKKKNSPTNIQINESEIDSKIALLTTLFTMDKNQEIKIEKIHPVSNGKYSVEFSYLNEVSKLNPDGNVFDVPPIIHSGNMYKIVYGGKELIIGKTNMAGPKFVYALAMELPKQSETKSKWVGCEYQ